MSVHPLTQVGWTALLVMVAIIVGAPIDSGVIGVATAGFSLCAVLGIIFNLEAHARERKGSPDAD
jgi:hypothetical protein